MGDEIPAEDLRIEAIGYREKGGQHVGTGSPGVRITHIPTNTFAECEIARSQHKNKIIAMDMIMSALTHPMAGSTTLDKG